ncbi:hypothetical protein MTR67_036344, partial [Solanum verrucosum]
KAQDFIYYFFDFTHVWRGFSCILRCFLDWNWLVIDVKREVIDYASSQLKVHEKNYPTYCFDLAVVVFAFKF